MRTYLTQYDLRFLGVYKIAWEDNAVREPRQPGRKRAELEKQYAVNTELQRRNEDLDRQCDRLYFQRNLCVVSALALAIFILLRSSTFWPVLEWAGHFFTEAMM